VFPPNEIALALPEAIWHHELPLHGASTSLYLLLTRRIHESVTVLITGEGADDIFLGYFADWSFTEDPRSHFKLFVNGGFLKELFGKDAEERAIQKRLAVSSHARLDGMTPCQKASVVTMESVLHGLFARHDRMFMAHSIEGRPPFCANDIVRARFPLVDTQIHSNQQGKIVVKELARRYFERDFVYRKKIGFSAPYGDWCASEDYWRSYVDRLDISFLRELLDSSPLDRVLAMPEGKEKWSGSNLNLIFSLTNFILWHDIFIESRDPTSESAWQSVVPSHFS
jgi:asparagine synthase (glutamine-hydrolysing)